MTGAFPFSTAYHDPQVGLAQMDRAGITHRLITFPGALGVDVLSADAASEISAFNAHLADLGHQTKGRLIGLAGLPLADIARAVQEVTAIRALGLPDNNLATLQSLAPLAPHSGRSIAPWGAC